MTSHAMFRALSLTGRVVSPLMAAVAIGLSIFAWRAYLRARAEREWATDWAAFQRAREHRI